MKTVLLACAIAFVAVTGSALAQQRATLFHDHNGVNDGSTNQTPVIALQTADDVRRSPSTEVPHWGNSLADFQPAYASARKVKTYAKAASRRQAPPAQDTVYTPAYQK